MLVVSKVKSTLRTRAFSLTYAQGPRTLTFPYRSSWRRELLTKERDLRIQNVLVLQWHYHPGPNLGCTINLKRIWLPFWHKPQKVKVMAKAKSRQKGLALVYRQQCQNHQVLHLPARHGPLLSIKDHTALHPLPLKAKVSKRASSPRVKILAHFKVVHRPNLLVASVTYMNT